MPSRKSSEFTEGAVLETIVPHSSNVDLEEEVNSGVNIEGQGFTVSLSKISQRQRLYFDESIDVYILLRSPYLEEDILKAYLSRVTISVEAYAISVPTENTSIDEDQPAETPQPTRDTLWSSTAQDFEEPLVVVHGNDDNSDQGYVFAIWKVKVPLRRPRIRSQKQDANITAIAYFKAAEDALVERQEEEEYLPSGQPAGMNLLQPFKEDRGLEGVAPYLSASRVSRILPAKQVAKELLRPLKSSTKSIRFVPAISARVRYSRVMARSGQPGLIASLDFEVISQLDVILKEVRLRPGGGTCEDLMNRHGIQLPLRCGPRDVVTLLYRLTPDRAMDRKALHTPGIRGLDITVLATGITTKDCKPQLDMQWKAALDFSATVNPSFGGPSPSIQRARRPSSLPFAVSRTSSPSGSIHGHGTETPPNADGFGVTITFSGPPTVRVGDTFTWTALIVNRSSRHRKLSMTVISDRRKTDIKIPNFTPVFSGARASDVVSTEAYVDQNIVHGLQRSKRMEPADLVSLTTDLRIGPLAPSACHSTELRFLAIGVGALLVDAIRVTDLATQDSVDVVDLPTVVSLKK